MAKKQFKTESKRLLDLMVNSIYTHKDIFLRELISNASDAIDKLAYKALTDDKVGLDRSQFQIALVPDKEARTLTISDNGIGMTAEELEKNLGTIARSGSLQFKKDIEDGKREDVDIIGQFGVGFYSAFMVADAVTVLSRAYGEDVAHRWTSKGADGYTIEEATREAAGTDVVLHIKPQAEGEDYDSYLDPHYLEALVKKHSDYIHYPIRMEMEHSRQKPKPEDAGDDYKPEYETYTELETLNSMVPIWKRPKSEVKDEDYNEFYKNKFMDYPDPLRVITSRTEGTATYTALLFVPGRTPYDYYTKEYEKGLALYASGVMIMEKCADLLPDYFSFIKGVVDSEDLSLNISRETLQKDSQLKLIRNSLEKKIKNELHAMLVNDREKYETFWKSFGRQIKFGVYGDYGMHKDLLGDLLMFYSAKEQKMVTLDEYIEKMPEGQKCIYFAAGDDTDRLGKLPNAASYRLQMAGAYYDYGRVCRQRQDYAEACSYYKKALSLLGEEDWCPGAVWIYVHYGRAAYALEDHPRAQAMFRRGYEAGEKNGELYGLAAAAAYTAYYEMQNERYDRAAQALTRAREVSQQLDSALEKGILCFVSMKMRSALDLERHTDPALDRLLKEPAESYARQGVRVLAELPDMFEMGLMSQSLKNGIAQKRNYRARELYSTNRNFMAE